MFNSDENEILNAHKYENIKKFRFIQLRYAQNANNCWYFNIYEQEEGLCLAELIMKKVL